LKNGNYFSKTREQQNDPINPLQIHLNFEKKEKEKKKKNQLWH